MGRRPHQKPSTCMKPSCVHVWSITCMSWGRAGHPHTRLKGMKFRPRKPFTQKGTTIYASPQSRPTHQAATGPASSHPQLCPVWMARPPHIPRRAHALLAHDALPAPLSHLDHLAAMHAAVLMSAGGMRQLSFSIIGQLRGTPKTATAAPWANASLLLS